MHFETQAANYARARPLYPNAFWDTIRDHHLLRPGRHVLDLGAGTGQATGPLLDAGLRVTAVEPGPQLAEQLRVGHPAADVIVSRAEDIDLPAGSFDIVVAATSIHWMNLDVVLPKVHRLLVPSGKLLVWRNVFGDPSVTTPFRDRVAEIVRARDAPPRPGPDAEDVEATSTELTRRGLFVVDDISTFRWRTELDDQQVRRLFSTFSDWSAREVERAVDATVDLGGHVVEHYTTWLIVLSPRRLRVR